MPIAASPFTEESYSCSSCRLRLLQPVDADVLSKTLASMDPWRTLGYAETSLRRYLCNPDPALRRFSLWTPEALAGVICVRSPWLRGPYLELLAVLPPAQGQGLGQAAIRWLEQEGRTVAQNIWTVASAFNARALAFYRHAGFTEAARLPDLVSPGHTEILLRKMVAAQPG